MFNRSKRICMAIFAAAVVFSGLLLAACGAPSVSNAGFYKEWQALDSEVKHDEKAQTDEYGNYTGGQAVDGYWQTYWIITHQLSTVQCRLDEITVEPGYYRFAVDFSVSDNNLGGEMQSYDNIAELRVYESSGKNIAFRAVNRYEMKQIHPVFEEKSITFYVGKKTKINLFFNTKGNAFLRTDKLRLEAIKPAEHIVADYYEMLRAKDENLTYDKDALYFFDLYRYLRDIPDTTAQYDLSTIVFAIQGFANRGGQHLFVNFLAPSWLHGGVDTYWLEELQKPGNELEGKNVVQVERFETLLRLFGNKFNGLIAWDEAVPATYNNACTAAGVENLLPVRYSANDYSLFSVLKNRFGIPVKINLQGKFTGKGTVWGTKVRSTGSKKCDSYVWGREVYLKTGRTNPLLMAQHLDAWTSDFTWPYGEQVVQYGDIQQRFLPNKDYLFAKKAFFWDLNPYGMPDKPNEPDYSIPWDDQNQPHGADFRTLTSLLDAQNRLAGDNIISVSGFNSWFTPKYSNFSNMRPEYPDAVAYEWHTSDLLGAYNMGSHGDAYGMTGQGPLANASVYMHIPQLERYEQPGDRTAQYRPENQILEDINYVVIYMGDYDSSAWTNQVMITRFFEDEKRGEIPLMWPILPQVAERVPHVISRLYETATPNDYFVGGDVGYIYGNPQALIDESRPLGLDGRPLNGTIGSYERRTVEEFNKFDIDIMGFLITSTWVSEELAEVYARISPKGIIANIGFDIENRPNRYLIDYRGTPDNYDDDTPMIKLVGGGGPGDSAELMAYYMSKELPVPDRPTFTVFRNIVAKPSDVVDAVKMVDPGRKMKVVDPYTFFNLFKENSIRGLKK